LPKEDKLKREERINKVGSKEIFKTIGEKDEVKMWKYIFKAKLNYLIMLKYNLQVLPKRSIFWYLFFVFYHLGNFALHVSSKI